MPTCRPSRRWRSTSGRRGERCFARKGYVSPGDDSGGNGKQLYATLLTGPDDVDRLDDERDEIHAFVSETDFERRAVLVVQTGWGSGSILPHLKRIEATDTGPRPAVTPARATPPNAARPRWLGSARRAVPGVVSLTGDPSTRYNVATAEDVVTADQSNDPVFFATCR